MLLFGWIKALVGCLLVALAVLGFGLRGFCILGKGSITETHLEGLKFSLRVALVLFPSCNSPVLSSLLFLR